MTTDGGPGCWAKGPATTGGEDGQNSLKQWQLKGGREAERDRGRLGEGTTVNGWGLGK